MPFEIVRNDISRIRAEALVCPDCGYPSVGGGCDSALYHRAGPGLFETRRALGHIPQGQVRPSGAFGLDARYVLFASVPDTQSGEAALSRCYDKCLNLALELGCRSVAIPLLGAGERGWSAELALKCAMESLRRFLEEAEMDVSLVLFAEQPCQISQRLYAPVKSYIDSKYVREREAVQARADFASQEDWGSLRNFSRRLMLRTEEKGKKEKAEKPRKKKAQECTEERIDRCGGTELYTAAPPAPMHPAPAAPAACPQTAEQLQQMLREMDAGFSEKLMALIDRKGLTDPQVYKRANIDRKLFSKIRSKPDYRPGKATVLALAVALELSLEETKDILSSAGFAMSRSSKADIILEYFIREGIYDIFEINQTLFAFDQPLLGG